MTRAVVAIVIAIAMERKGVWLVWVSAEAMRRRQSNVQ